MIIASCGRKSLVSGASLATDFALELERRDLGRDGAVDGCVACGCQINISNAFRGNTVESCHGRMPYASGGQRIPIPSQRRYMLAVAGLRRRRQVQRLIVRIIHPQPTPDMPQYQNDRASRARSCPAPKTAVFWLFKLLRYTGFLSLLRSADFAAPYCCGSFAIV